MKEFRAGIIGCGRIGAQYDESGIPGVFTHAGMYRNTPGLTLVCAAEMDQKRREAFARFWGVAPGSVYNDYLDMLQREKPDIVSITTPDITHARIVADMIEAEPPKIILCEKPLADDVETCRNLARRCRARGVTLLVNYIRRWDEATLAARAFLAAGGIGRIQRAICHYVRGLGHNGCHLVNMTRFLFGECVKAESIGRSLQGSFEGDSSLDVRLTFANGTEALLLAQDVDGYNYSIYDLDIFGSAGRLRITRNGDCFELSLSVEDERFSGFKKLQPKPIPWREGTFSSAMLRAGSALWNALAQPGNWIENTASEAIRDMEAIDMAKRHAYQHR